MKTITFFENNADDRYAGKVFEMFPVRFNPEFNEWEECEESETKYWGILTSFGISPFLYDPSEFGIIEER